MITGELKNKIDRLWHEFRRGGIANPLSVIEQITYLVFIRMLDLEEIRHEIRASRTGKPCEGRFDGSDDKRRWSNLLHVGSDKALNIVRDDVFPQLKQIAGRDSTFGRYMEDATFTIGKPSLLSTAMELIDDLPLDKGDLKGDLYEYLLSKLPIAGIAGQFRTPPHITRMMVDLTEPQLTDRIADPCCGTAGFLCEVIDYLHEHHSSDAGIIKHEDENGTTFKSYLGDEISPEACLHMQTNMFAGFDFDVSMLRIAVMNMMLHGVDNPTLEYMDTLSNRLFEKRPKLASNAFDLILTNPPFGGKIDNEQIDRSLSSKLKTSHPELMFPLLMLRMLKIGGRCACIVPEGVLSRFASAHIALRKMLIEEHNLEAVISMPPGVFQPYSGISSAVIIFRRTEWGDSLGTGHEIATSKKTGLDEPALWFYHMEHDGYSLGRKRDKIDDNDIPGVIEHFHARLEEDLTDRKEQYFAVPLAEIRENNYDLSINQYREISYEEPDCDPPKEILDRLKTLEHEIAKGREELERMLR